MSRPSAWLTVWTNFLRSFGGRQRYQRSYVGEDQFGNRYYELNNAGRVTNVKRGVDAAPNAPPPPPEWNMWLKNTRKFPPANEEIEYTKLRQQKMQALLQQQDAETERRAPLVQSQGRGAADVDRATVYPTYSDIEMAPGAKAQHGTYTEQSERARPRHSKPDDKIEKPTIGGQTKPDEMKRKTDFLNRTD